ncbi:MULTISPECIES: hypothetical protein [unclassified Fusibacter]|uniref:hypothetical protein n=1 Tax=unclassified Fusibacter TaxID=2624464 RepID=UPI0010127FAA|nr:MULTISPECIES: hypothetical protein [unclassified Fusibacter]MCK8058580.1 hypothetical protein [Fusibacter sp. A2]NPE22650.1 hypothetical protein [Fusibacter sp. A1]RXV60213.1 hypothetical protein DWB64_12435 [Fusibacter sp. A1]
MNNKKTGKKIPKYVKEFHPKATKKACCHGKHSKGIFTLVSICAVVTIATSAMSWIGFMNIKKNGGKLPWER